MESGIYAMLVLLNNIGGSSHYKDISKVEKVGIASSVLLGLDAVLVPALSGGRTLHQMVIESMGVSIPQAVEYGIELGESGLAYAGQVYHAARNLHLASKVKVKE